MKLSRLKSAFDGRIVVSTRNRVLLGLVDSTNVLAKRIVRSFADRELPPPALLVIASQQLAGRGRLGREWVSQPGRGAYFSLVTVATGDDELASLPLLVGAALSRRISEICACSCRLKWPNDLMVSGRKIGGILIECVTRGAASSGVVIGIGVNYSPSPEVSKVGGIAMQEIASGVPQLTEVIVDLIAAVESELPNAGDMSYAVARCRESSAHRLGDSIHFRTVEGMQRGTFSGIDARGCLILQSAEGGRILLSAGEIIEERTGVSHEP
jgi:BirA family biotin operon repressor/biotin-[acetyl-CoA-carboxylase] ligase